MTPHLRAARQSEQSVWIAFGGEADQAWLRPLRRGFRHCFAALQDEDGWTVLEPLSGRLMVMRLAVPATFDLPGFYRRAGLAVAGPFVPGAPCRTWLPAVLPMNCVGLCRAALGKGAPFAVTPWGLFRGLAKVNEGNRKKVLTMTKA